jgi:hypothetical protein
MILWPHAPVTICQSTVRYLDVTSKLVLRPLSSVTRINMALLRCFLRCLIRIPITEYVHINLNIVTNKR